jgi:hypothetical protein
VRLIITKNKSQRRFKKLSASLGLVLLNKVRVFSLRLMSRSMATAVAYLTMRSEETAK